MRTLLLGCFLLTLGLLAPPSTQAACHPIEVTWYSPTGIAGCEVYGTGTASQWGGPGVARNDCLWPWTDCTAIRITSLATGRSVVVVPTMYCDCYTGTGDERLVDLDPRTLMVLGLNPALGLHPVSVHPASPTIRSLNRGGLPDTAMH